jgi:hypothetical protein
MAGVRFPARFRDYEKTVAEKRRREPHRISFMNSYF